jgi:hypothetical protein
MRKTPLLAAALALVAGSVARADTVEVSSTTLVTAGQQTRDGLAGGKPELVTVVPAYELLTIEARNVTNPLADDLRIVFSGWGAYDFADRRWDNGTGSDLTGDITVGYVQGQLAQRHLQLRVGREMVMTGVGRMIQIDGGEAIAILPGGFRISGYAGSPVSQRFSTRSGILSWNPVGGDLAYGGRLGWSLALPGLPGRGLDVGASANVVEDSGDPVRQEVGADFRLQTVGDLTFTGFGAYSLYDERFSEGNVGATWSPVRKLHVTADWRFVAPDLLLARNSILSVFAATTRKSYGGGATYELRHGLTAGADYHLVLEPGSAPDETFYGTDAAAHVDFERGKTLVGAEASYLDALENGYVGGRVYGRQGFGRFFGAADVLATFFKHDVNAQSYALTGTLTAGVELARGFSAVISGRAGVTPFLEQTFDIMAKLVYNQTYRSSREVR